MKILQLPTIDLDTNTLNFNLSTIWKAMLIIASFIFILFLLFHAQYIKAFGFAALSITCIQCYRLYQEVVQLDFDIDGAELTLEEIIEELR